MKNLTKRVPKTTRRLEVQIFSPYSTVTSACQGSLLTCTRTVSIFKTLKYMQTRFCHKNKTFCI